MTAIVNKEPSKLDSVLLALAVLIMAAAATLYYIYSDVSQLMRTLGVVGAVIVALLLAWRTAIGQATLTFLGDARMEVRKVVWPSRQETIQVTLMVLLMVIVMGLILWGFDTLLSWGIGKLLQGGN